VHGTALTDHEKERQESVYCATNTSTRVPASSNVSSWSAVIWYVAVVLRAVNPS
jgi:hypothetical protein